tara:strand:- start:41 stop:709 length:669 start_codon:yes stop_codon:yes gene_type:complete
MAYFQELPNIAYPSLLPTKNKVEQRIIVKNIFRRSKLRTDVDQAITAFDYYYIGQGMRPDMVAKQVYDDSELDWVILTTNNIQNIRDQWPLEHNDLHEYMLEKYGSEENILKVKHHETRKIVDEFNRVVVPAGLKVDSNFSFEYLNNAGQPIYVSPNNIVVEVTRYDYEVKLNEEKRRIKILKPEFLSLLIDDHRRIMSYGKSSDYISRKLKTTYNPNIVGV